MPLSSGKITAYAVFLTAVLALLAPVVIIERSVLQQTAGNIVLPKDESFINLAIAKNLAFYKVWGLSKHSFQAASSSLLYPLILTPVFFITGSHLVIPLVINSLAAIFLLWLLQQSLIRRGLSAPSQLAILLLVIFLPPLPFLILNASEYMLLLLLAALFALSYKSSLNGPLPRSVFIYAFLLVATRYEGLLIIAIACLLLIRGRRREQALRLGLIAALPILIFGAISLWKGNYFIPLPLVLPSEGYTAGLAGALLVLLLIVPPLPKGRQSLAACTIVAIISLARTISVLGGITQDCINTYTRPVQAARFVHRYFNRYGVGLDEIGAAAYFSDGRKVDLTGIANHTILKSKRQHYWTPKTADSLIRREGAYWAILSDERSDSGSVSHWNKVATWNHPGDNISFYAADTGFARRLKQNLREYETSLPAGVRASYY